MYETEGRLKEWVLSSDEIFISKLWKDTFKQLKSKLTPSAVRSPGRGTNPHLLVVRSQDRDCIRSFLEINLSKMLMKDLENVFSEMLISSDALC